MAKKTVSSGFTDFSSLGGLDPSVADLLAQGDVRQAVRQMTVEERQAARKAESKRVHEREKMQARAPYRATYDLPQGMKARIEALAGDLQTPASQVAAVLLTYALCAVEHGVLDLGSLRRPSESPRYAYVLALPEENEMNQDNDDLRVYP